MRGHGWQVFGVIAVLVIGVDILAAVIEAIGDSAGTGAGIVVTVIVQILTAPLAALAASVLYFELRDAAGDGHASRAARAEPEGTRLRAAVAQPVIPPKIPPVMCSVWPCT